MLLTDSNCPKITGFNALTTSSGSDRATGGVTLFVNNDHLFGEIQLSSPLQAVATRITLNKIITVCSIYLSPSEYASETGLKNLTGQLPSALVLLGDLNGHHLAGK